MFLHVHAVQIVAVKGGQDAGQQDAELLPVCVVFLIGDGLRFRHGFDSGHCFFQGGIEAFFQFRAKGQFFLLLCIFQLQGFQSRRKDAHILSEQLPHDALRGGCGGFGHFVVYHFLQQFLIDSHLSHAVRREHLAEDFHLALGVGGNLFFRFGGRYGRAVFRIRNLDSVKDFLAFIQSLFHAVRSLFAGLLCPFSDFV